MLTLCSGLSHYFPDAFSNKYVLPSVTELLKQRSLQHRSIAIALAHTGVRRAKIRSNERQSPNETQSSPSARSPRTAEAAAATVGSGGYAGGAGNVAGVDVAFVCMQSSLSKHHQALQNTLGSNIWKPSFAVWFGFQEMSFSLKDYYSCNTGHHSLHVYAVNPFEASGIIKPCRKHWGLTFESLLFQFGFDCKKCLKLSKHSWSFIHHLSIIKPEEDTGFKHLILLRRLVLVQ